MNIMTAKKAKEMAKQAETNRFEEFKKIFYDEKYCENFNIAVQEAAMNGKDRAMVPFPQGYIEEAIKYFETSLGFMTVTTSKPGLLYVGW